VQLTEQIKDWPGWFEARESDHNVHSRFFKVAGRFGGIAPKVPGFQWAYYAARTPAYAYRRRRISKSCERNTASKLHRWQTLRVFNDIMAQISCDKIKDKPWKEEARPLNAANH
jgi:hypothetical protein